MNLQEYFKTLQTTHLSNAQKNTIYERILQQTQGQSQKPLFNRMRFYTKLAGYVFFLGILGFSLYLPFIAQQNSRVGGIPSGAVHADYIAKVVDIQGDYYIESNENRINASNITDGDTIVLADKSSLVVHVGDNIEGKITGPAVFQVHKKESGYTITLEKGNYIELTTIGKTENAPQVAVVSIDHKFTAVTQAGKDAHFVLTERDEKPLLVNQAKQDIIVHNEGITGEDNTTLLAQNKIFNITEGEVIKNGDMIFVATKGPSNQAIGEVIAAATRDDETGPTDTNYNNGFFRELLLKETNNTAEIATENSNEHDTGIVLALARTTATTPQDAVFDSNTTIIRGKGTTTTTQDTIDMQTVRENLIPQFIWVDIKYITYYYLNGQEKEYNTSYTNLSKRIDNLYTALSLSSPVTFMGTYKIQNLSIALTYLSNNLPLRVSRDHTNTINTLTAYLNKLQAKSFGEYKNQGLSLDEMFTKIQ